VKGAQGSAEVLLSRALAADDEQQRSGIVAALHARTDLAAFEAACVLTGSGVLAERLLGLEVLGQIGYPADRPFLRATLSAVLACCDDDRPVVLSSAITALGHLADARAFPAVLARVAHPCAEVRLAVAGDSRAAEAAAALIQLTRDVDPEVRDWATMALSAPFEADRDELRDALAARLADTEGDTAGEALLGLAQRQDPRTLAPLLDWLDVDHPGNLIVEAAAALGAAEALPALQRLKSSGWQDHDCRPSVLDQAIEACSG
jgi:HEAT repeat protein